MSRGGDESFLRLLASVRFYAELNDFLPPGQRQKTLTHTFETSDSPKSP